MPKPYSADLRERVLLADEAGLPPAAIAQRFGVATASGVNQTVRLPRARRAASYSVQLVTRCFCFGM